MLRILRGILMGYEKIINALLKDVSMEKAEQLKKVSVILQVTSLSLMFLPLFNPNFYAHNMPLAFSYIVSSLTKELFNYVNYDGLKDVKEFKKLYDEVLINFNQLKNEFNFNDNIELCTLINHCVKNGYLSSDKKFIFSDSDVTDIRSIAGSNLMAGNGVCRHISSFYKDMLDLNNIKNCMVPVHSMIYLEMQSFIDELKNDESLELLPLKEFLNCFLKDEKKSMKLANHVINMLSDDNLIYYLDPTALSMYVTTNEEGILIDKCDIKTKAYSNQIYGNNIKIYKELSKLETAKLELFDEQKQKALDICFNNQDIIEKFYIDNNELFDEIKSKIDKFKTKKSKN